MRQFYALLFVGCLLRYAAALPQAATSIVAYDPSTDPESIDMAQNMDQPAQPPQLSTTGAISGSPTDSGTVDTTNVINQSTVSTQNSTSASVVAPNTSTGSGVATTTSIGDQASSSSLQTSRSSLQISSSTLQDSQTSSSSQASSSSLQTSITSLQISSSSSQSSSSLQSSTSAVAYDPKSDPESLDTASNENHCTLSQPPQYGPFTGCENMCGKAVAAQVAAGNTSSLSCIAFANPIQWVHFDGDMNVTLGNCSCNNSFIDLLANTYVEAITVVAEIGCEILMAALNLVLGAVEDAISMIPGVGQAMDGGMIALTESAKLASYTYDSSSAALGAFSNWLNPCGNTSAVPPDLQKAFDAFNAVDDAILPGGRFRAPTGVKPGSGKPGDSGDPNPPPKGPDRPKTPDPPKSPDPPKTPDLPKSPDPPKSPDSPKTPDPHKSDNPPKTSDLPKTTDPPKTSEPSKTTERKSSSSDEACSLEKRAPGAKNNCGVSITRIKRSEAVTKVIPRTCKAISHTQACYHYYSAFKNYDHIQTTFTCSDFHARDQNGNAIRQDLKATSTWKTQHNTLGWKEYTQPLCKWYPKATMIPPGCEADEYPPAYFLTPAVNDIKFGQLVRWIPGRENGGAASMWKMFCATEDGGAGNGQTFTIDRATKNQKSGEINSALVSGVGKASKENEQRGIDGTTTTTFAYDTASFTRAVFDMKFDWTGVEEPSEKNYWGLRTNPCWPEGILPDDPGYVLFTDDKFYDKPPNPDYRHLYDSSAPAAMMAAAPKPSGWKPRPSKKPKSKGATSKPVQPSPFGSSAANKNAKPSGRKQPRHVTAGFNNRQAETGSGGSRRALDVIEDGLIFRDVNSTRRLTEEEIDQGIEVIDCADHDCSEERRALNDDDDFFIIPGEPPSPIPSANADSAPTIVPVATTLKTRVEKRTLASPELPKATGSPAELSP